MVQKRNFPPRTPLQEENVNNNYPCSYCSWVGYSERALIAHKSIYHESLLVKEGDRSLREGGDLVERNNRWLLAHGYVKCPWLTVPCPTRINPVMARVCTHLNDCPDRR